MEHKRRHSSGLIRRCVRRVRKRYGALSLLREPRLGVLGAANLLDVMSVSIIVPLLPGYAQQLGAGPAFVGLLFAAPTVTRALLSVPLGYLSDRTGRRLWIAGGMIVGALSVMALGLAAAPITLLALRALDGVAAAARAPASVAYVGDTVSESDRGRAMGAYRTTGVLGVAIGPAVGGALAVTVGLAAPFLVLGGASLLAGVALAVGLPRATSGGAATGKAAERSAHDDGGEATTGTHRRALRAHLRRSIPQTTTPTVAALSVSALVAEIGTGAVGPLLALLLAETVGGGPGYVGVVWATFGASMAVWMPLGGSLADERGRKSPLLAGKVLWAGVMIGLAGATVAWLPPALLFIAGLASGLAGPALGALRYETAPEDTSGAVLGWYGTLGSVGRAIGPIVGGALGATVGLRATAIAVGLLWVFDAMIITVGVRERRGSADDPGGMEATP